ncbi:MAG: hypothetical protein JO337_11120 [Acidimicrobiales bacterium]|nr:hypothetical protein [Acidimicrobiales bacterium]
MTEFRDRREAGRRLAELVAHHMEESPAPEGLVAALPRGGVPVAFEVARFLGWPLDVVLVRKLGVPVQPELAFGAIGEDATKVLNPDVVRAAALTVGQVAEVERRQLEQLDRQAAVYRSGRPPLSVAGRTVVVVDDGMATGASARVACQVLQARDATRLIVAVPVATRSVVEDLRYDVEVVCPLTPDHMVAVGQWYRDFSQVPEEEVVQLLGAS